MLFRSSKGIMRIKNADRSKGYPEVSFITGDCLNESTEEKTKLTAELEAVHLIALAFQQLTCS